MFQPLGNLYGFYLNLGYGAGVLVNINHPELLGIRLGSQRIERPSL